MYPKRIRDEGFTLYAQDLSYADIAEELRRKYRDVCPRLKTQTVAAWAKQDKWHARDARIRKQTEMLLDQKIVDDRARTIATMKTFRDDLFDKAKRLKPKSAESALWAALALDKRIDEKTGERGKFGFKGDVQRVVMIIFEVLSQDHKLQEILQSKESFFLKSIEQRLLGAGTNTNAEVKP